MSTFGNVLLSALLGLSPYTAGTTNAIALSSAYVHGTSGAAIGWRCSAPVAKPITDVYLFCTATSGTPGSVTVEIRNFGASVSQPGSTVNATKTFAWTGSANTWSRATFSSPYTPALNEVFWVVISNADGSPATNFPTVQGTSVVPSPSVGTNPRMANYSTANGWSTTGTGTTSNSPCLLIVFSDGTTTVRMGCPYTTTGTHTSNTLRRGLHFDGLPAGVTINSVLATVETSFSGVEVYSGSTTFGGTTVATAAATANQLNANNAMPIAFATPVTLSANTVYDVVATFSASSTAPGYYQIQDYARYADVQASAFAGGTIYGVVDNGSGGRTVDKSTFPRMCVFLDDLVAASGGSWDSALQGGLS